jgi:hypothetical protein
LRDAAKEIVGNIGRALVVTDAGSENVNRDVDGELSGASLEPVLAQIDVTYSNSMIEAFWCSLKHSWLYLHGLESESELRRLIAFYVQAHNEVMPHSAFNGQTPDEVYFGTGRAIAAELAAGRVRARDARMVRNRADRCSVCVGRAGWVLLQLRRLESLTRDLDVAMIIDAATHRSAGASARDFTPQNNVNVRGRTDGIEIWSLSLSSSWVDRMGWRIVIRLCHSFMDTWWVSLTFIWG